MIVIIPKVNLYDDGYCFICEGNMKYGGGGGELTLIEMFLEM
jgi:hypothetical protein